MKRRVLFWVLLVGLVGLDQYVKAWSRENISRGGSFEWPIRGVFEMTLTYNEGIAFGLFQGAGVLLAPVAVAIAVGAAWYSLKHPKEVVTAHVAAALLAAGALGNLYDRIAHGKVTDMFIFRFVDFPVFNIADACITFAAILLIYNWIREPAKTAHPVPGPVETPAPSAE